RAGGGHPGRGGTRRPPRGPVRAGRQWPRRDRRPVVGQRPAFPLPRPFFGFALATAVARLYRFPDHPPGRGGRGVESTVPDGPPDRAILHATVRRSRSGGP